MGLKTIEQANLLGAALLALLMLIGNMPPGTCGATKKGAAKSSTQSQIAAKPATAKKNNAKMAWMIRFDAGLYTAPSTVYLTEGAIKISTDGGFEIGVSSPTWNAIVINNKDKSYCKLKREQWKQGFFLDKSSSDLFFVPKNAKSDEETVYRGIKARRLIWITKESDDYYRARNKPKKTIVELIQSTEIPCGKMQSEALSAWYSVPSLAGVPLFFAQRQGEEQQIKMRLLDLTTAPLSALKVAPKPGYRQVPKMYDMMDKKYKDSLGDVLEYEAELNAKESKVDSGKNKVLNKKSP